MARFVDEFAEQHQQTGHQRKDRQHTEQDGLDQHGSQVAADAKVHERQCGQAADGRQRRRGNLRDSLGKRGDTGFPHVERLVLIAEAVAQDDGIVDSQRQLQNDRDRVGDEADGAAQEVGAHVQQRGGTEGHDEHRHLGIGAGGQRQYHHDNDGGDDDDNTHFRLQVGRGIIADLGVDRGVVAFQLGANLVHRGLSARVVDLAVKADREQRGGILVVVGGLVELDGVHAVDILELFFQLDGLVVGDVGHHDAGRAVGGEIVIHHGQALARLGRIRQIGGDIVLYLDPARGNGAENQRKDV